MLEVPPGSKHSRCCARIHAYHMRAALANCRSLRSCIFSAALQQRRRVCRTQSAADGGRAAAALKTRAFMIVFLHRRRQMQTLSSSAKRRLSRKKIVVARVFIYVAASAPIDWRSSVVCLCSARGMQPAIMRASMTRSLARLAPSATAAAAAAAIFIAAASTDGAACASFCCTIERLNDARAPRAALAA